MSRAAQLRSTLETSLEQRIPSAFSPQARVELPTISSGIAELDALLQGGLPVGAITELVGSASSGRLTCANSFVAQVMRAGHVCAWVDVSDSFDPESAAGNGIDLARLLWVRCGGPLSDAPQPSRSLTPVASSHSNATQPLGGGSHPRSEVRGLSQAIDTLLSHPAPTRRQQIGTPGAPNRRLERVEQVAFDRLPARRGSNLLHDRHQAARPSVPAAGKPLPSDKPFARPQKPWSRLDQALRATDLLMHGGGFGALVLDLGSVDPLFATRIPLATWFRFRAAAERTRTAFLLLSQHPCAHSSAEVVLRTSLALPQAGTVLTTVPFRVERVRQRFTPAPNPVSNNVLSMRKPPARATSATWSAATSWAGGRNRVSPGVPQDENARAIFSQGKWPPLQSNSGTGSGEML